MTAEEWALKINDLIESAHADGMEISGYSDCCGCTRKIFLSVVDKSGREATVGIQW